VPIYEYLCEDCGKVTESLQKVNDPPPKTCGECGGRHLAKLVSRSAFQLKGGGWYADLYSSPKKAAGGDAAGATPAAPGATAPASGAAAPAKPAPAKPATAAEKKPSKSDKPSAADK